MIKEDAKLKKSNTQQEKVSSSDGLTKRVKFYLYFIIKNRKM